MDIHDHGSGASMMNPVPPADKNVFNEVQKPASQAQSACTSPEEGVAPSRKKAVSPISELNEDMLILIFSYGIDDEDDGLKNDNVVTIMNVCQRWYGIAIGYPAFWTSIDFRNASWANAMLRRAHTLPLSINLNLNRAINVLSIDNDLDFSKFDSRIFDLSRIAQLKLQIRSSQWKVLDIFHGISALRSLHFKFIRFTLAYEDPIVLPLHFFPLNTHLRHLQLEGCRVSWDSLDLECLAELISLDLDPYATPYSMGQLCGVLSATKKLQRLLLHADSHEPYRGLVDLDSSPHGESPPSTILPRLTLLRVHATLHTCVEILAHILYPTDAQVHLTAVDNTPLLLPSLMNHESFLRENRPNNQRNLHIRSRWTPVYHGFLVLWDGPIDLLRPSLSVVPSDPLTRLNYLRLDTPRLVGALTVPHLRFLYFEDAPVTHNEDRCSVEEWRSFFHRHSELIHLRVETRDVTRIAAALSPTGDEGAPLPNLTSLSLHNQRGTLDRATAFTIEKFQALLRCLTGRYVHGLRLETLIVGSNYKMVMDVDEAVQLQYMVKDVVWIDSSMEEYYMGQWVKIVT